MTTTATVSLAGGNRYETDPVLVGRRVQLVFDPFDLTAVEIRCNQQSFGRATVHDIRTHVHLTAAGHRDTDDPPVASGIDYLALVAADHRDATRRSINFADLPTREDEQPDERELPDPWPHERPLPFDDPDDDQQTRKTMS